MGIPFEGSARAAALGAAIWLAATPADAGSPAVVELFTSQSCYSCPPAEAFLGELSRRPDVIALEFHVDYWDDLVYGAAGKWKDRFSQPALTDRQRRYNRAIRGKNAVYTPQIIVGGVREAVGSDRGAVEAAVARTLADPAPLAVTAALRSGSVAVTVTGAAGAPAKIWLIRYSLTQSTRVTGGENKDKMLSNHNVVTEAREVGAWTGGSVTVEVAGFALAAGEGCVVVVQDERPRPVLGAGQCKDIGS
jgi:hypothetical protein